MRLTPPAFSKVPISLDRKVAGSPFLAEAAAGKTFINQASSLGDLSSSVYLFVPSNIFTRRSPTMFHLVLAVASRFLYFGNVLQGLARGILALRNLGVISSQLMPSLPPPPPIPLLDASPFSELPVEIISPYPSAALITIERIQPQALIFSSPIPSYQSSLMPVTPSRLPNFLPLFVMLAITSGVVILLPAIVMNVAKLASAITRASKNISGFFSSNVVTPVRLLSVYFPE
jgi:hypothetical protein